MEAFLDLDRSVLF